eukprot:658994_1
MEYTRDFRVFFDVYTEAGKKKHMKLFGALPNMDSLMAGLEADKGLSKVCCKLIAAKVSGTMFGNCKRKGLLGATFSTRKQLNLPNALETFRSVHRCCLKNIHDP